MGEQAVLVGEGQEAVLSWDEILRTHAHRRRIGAAALPAEHRRALDAALGAEAGDAVAIVETFARGAQTDEPGSKDAFDRRLGLIVSGLGALWGASSAVQEGDLVEGRDDNRPNVIQSELWIILRNVRESADLFYARELDMVELDRRTLFLLHDSGPLVPAEVASSLGVDKAQVSRSVKRLLELRMVEREQIRAPLRLTRKGGALAERLSRLADLRNRELTIGIDDAELAEFFTCVQLLLERAVVLYEQERELAQGAARGGKAAEPAIRPGDRKLMDNLTTSRMRIVSPLITLSAYFSRSGALAYRRLTGLSNFEAFVLSEVGIAAPVEWNDLVAALQRDHSQAGRTIKSLLDSGLIEREGKPGRRHGRFYPSATGARLYQIIQDAGRERSAFLLAPLAPDQRARFLATVSKIRRSAVAQLERENVFAETDATV